MDRKVSEAEDRSAPEQGQKVAKSYYPSPSSSRATVLDQDGDQTLRRTIHNLFSAGSMLEELRVIMGESVGITGVQYQILMVIARLQHGTGVAIKDVAIELRVVPSHVTVEVGKLAARGFIEKLPNAADGRSVLLALTDKGIDAIERVTPFTCMINDGLFDGFSRQDFLTLGTLLNQFVSNAERTLATAVYKTDMASREGNTAKYSQHKTMVGEAT